MSIETSSTAPSDVSSANDVERPNQHAAREQHPIGTATWDQLGQIVELLSEPVNDAQQLDRLEVRRRRFAFRSPLGAQLAVEVLEEPVRRPDLTPIGQDRWVGSVSSIRRRIRSRVRANSS